MKPNILITSLLLFTSIAMGQNQSSVRKNAQLFANATINSDYNKMIYYLYPKVISEWGGRTAFINFNKRIDKGMSEEEGMHYFSIRVGEPGKMLLNGSREFYLLKDTIIMLGKRTIVGASGIIAVSEDHGKRWYFINGGNDRWLYKMFPELRGKMAISTHVISQHD